MNRPVSNLCRPVYKRLLISAITVLGAIASLQAGNPIITNVFTADSAPLVVGDTVYLYCGQDEAKNDRDGYRMNRWLCFSTKDMKVWKEEGSPPKPTDFKWATGAAWASQVIERNGKFYWYAAVQHDESHHGKAIGVALASIASSVGRPRKSEASAAYPQKMWES